MHDDIAKSIRRRLKRSRIQAQYREAVKWLFDVYDHRQEGRSHLIMDVICELALTNPGKVYLYTDHYPSREMQRISQRKLLEFIAAHPLYRDRLKVTNDNQVQAI